MLPAGSLEGRVCLVTGGGTGLGRAIALELSRLGAAVAVCGRRPEPLEETVQQLAGTGFAVRCDVREPEQVEAAFAAVEDALGPVTTLVNNAAGNFVVPPRSCRRTAGARSSASSSTARSSARGSWRGGTSRAAASAARS